jgi:glutamate-1-semialdehyde aminotransferase
LGATSNLDGHLLPGLQPLGVPDAMRGSALPFTYNHIEELEALVKDNKIGVIVMEPTRHHAPENDFLQKVRGIADRVGAVLVFDEISSGFRLGFPGAHTRFGIVPDIAVYSKAISNGFPMAALVGKRSVMQKSEASFISSTYHSERIGPTAALATLKKMKRVKIDAYVDRMGKKIADIWSKAAKKHSLPIVAEGPYAMVTFNVDHPEAAALKAIYTQEMLAEGYLASATVYVSYAHKNFHLPAFARAVDRSFAILEKAIKSGNPRFFLKGPLPEVGFKRLT